MSSIPPKKSLGQHFLKEPAIAERIALALQPLMVQHPVDTIVEVGPGKGVLTQFLLQHYLDAHSIHAIEFDQDLIPILQQAFPALSPTLHQADFLEFSFDLIPAGDFAIIGNFPYNISSQIIFKTIEHRDRIPALVGMFQREVAWRICATPGTKAYGLLSIWAQAFYHTSYLFTVTEGCFNPPPKVKSGVLSMVRNHIEYPFPDAFLLQLLRSAFQQRRKTMRNSLRAWEQKIASYRPGILAQRPEELNTQQWTELAMALFASN